MASEKDILEWARSRGILHKGNIIVQTLKLQEEVGELSKAVLFSDRESIDDAIGDVAIVLVSLAHFNGSSLQGNIDKAFEIVKQRKGSMQNGNFVKEQDVQG